MNLTIGVADRVFGCAFSLADVVEVGVRVVPAALAPFLGKTTEK